MKVVESTPWQGANHSDTEVSRGFATQPWGRVHAFMSRYF
jgi:hypothetical protein